MHREALPPLLRGLGTLLILIVSTLVVLMERQEERRLPDPVARVDAGAAHSASADPPDVQLAALAREVRLLRGRLGDEDLADRVFENSWFQLLGLVGTALLALSFFIEAWQKRHRMTGTEDGTGDGTGDGPRRDVTRSARR